MKLAQELFLINSSYKHKGPNETLESSIIPKMKRTVQIVIRIAEKRNPGSVLEWNCITTLSRKKDI